MPNNSAQNMQPETQNFMAGQKTVFAVISLFVVASTASAATFAVRPDRELIHRADAIVVASALASYSILNRTGGIETVTPISIEEVIKGGVAGSTVNVVEPGGVYDGKAMLIAGVPRFAEGRRMLLFLMKTGEDRWSVLDLVVGKFTFADDRLGQKLLVRDEDEIVDVNVQPHREVRRSAERFLEFVRAEARGGAGAAAYAVPSAELTESTLTPALGRPTATATLQPAPLVAPFTATSYTMTISGSLGSRWNVFPSAVSIFMGTTQEPGAPGGGATAIQAAVGSWDGDCPSNVNYVYAGVDDGTHTQGLHGPDGRNTVLYERDLSAWGIPPFSCNANGYSGTLGIGGITSAGGSNVVSGETFVTTSEADVEMNRGIANCTLLLSSGDWNSAVTHEVGHTLGFRHADQNRASSGACSSDPSLECASSAIMTAFVTRGINGGLQTWDQHAVQAVYPGGSCGARKAPSDFNADRKSDLILQSSVSRTIVMWLMNGAHPMVSAQIDTPPSGWTAAGAGDIDGDGFADLLIRHGPTGTVDAYLMNGTSVKSFVGIGVSSGSEFIVGLADFNHDGKDDILLHNPSNGEVAIWYMKGSGILGTRLLGGAAAPWKAMAIGDFDGDGWPDLLLQNTSTGQVIEWRIQNSNIVANGIILTPPPEWHVMAAADVNGDGRDDVILQHTTGVVTAWMMNGFAVLEGRTVGTPNSSWIVKGRGDFNGDGVSDIVVQNSSTRAEQVWLMSGGSIATIGQDGLPADYDLMVNK
jgi:FG-GAP-like repeat